MLNEALLMLCVLCIALMWVFGYFAQSICTVARLMDVPGERKHHARPTPLVGGLALCLIMLPLSLVSIHLFAPADLRVSLLRYVVAVALIALIGMADDRHNLSARGRLVLSLAVFFILAMFDPLFNVRSLAFKVPHYEMGLWLNPLSYLFTTICCVGLLNAVNMADGKNGLVMGLLIGWLAILEHFVPPALFPLVLILQCGLLILFAYNLQGLVFLGDGGSYGFACAVGLLTIATYNLKAVNAAHSMGADVIVVMFIVPVVDSFRLTFSRLKRGLSPMSADRDHLHHHLQNKFGWPGGLIVYLVVALVPVWAWVWLFYR